VTKQRSVRRNDVTIEPLHVDVLRDGENVYRWPSLGEMRDQRRADIARLDPGVRRLIHPHIYHVSLSQRLWELKYGLMAAARPGA
jgi:nicotinate phosphoribosyltransferase